VREVFFVHFRPVIGSPAVSSFSKSANAFNISGCFFQPVAVQRLVSALDFLTMTVPSVALLCDHVVWSDGSSRYSHAAVPIHRVPIATLADLQTDAVLFHVTDLGLG
jgi:hypothetical protein